MPRPADRGVARAMVGNRPVATAKMKPGSIIGDCGLLVWTIN
jgi:hypothetical protein